MKISKNLFAMLPLLAVLVGCEKAVASSFATPLHNKELSHSSRRDLQVKLLLLVPKLASVFAAPLNNEELSHSSRRDLQQTCASGFTYNACANCCGYKFTTMTALQGAVEGYPANQDTYGKKN
jgi:hypothetical protein